MTTTPAPLRLGLNLDHVATLRNARGGVHPDPVRFAHLAVQLAPSAGVRKPAWKGSARSWRASR